MNALTIANTAIRQDADGRYCLNDLHRASGGEVKHAPAQWLRNNQTKELIAELETMQIPLVSIEGRNGGTYVAKELVYAYGMWISAAFNLKVIRGYDAMAAAPATFNPAQLLADPAALLNLLTGSTRKVLALESQVAEQAPKVAALDRLATINGSSCIRDAAKLLQLQPSQLTKWLVENRWIYRLAMGGGGWLAYMPRIQQGVLEHKITSGTKGDGSEWYGSQVRITAKGLARIGQLMATPQAVLA